MYSTVCVCEYVFREAAIKEDKKSAAIITHNTDAAVAMGAPCCYIDDNVKKIEDRGGRQLFSAGHMIIYFFTVRYRIK